MEQYILSNDRLTVTVNSKGCEIASVKDNKGQEYIWCANPNVWKRHTPVLFPLIGRYNKDISIYKGKEYKMTQHGFARDMEFTLVEKTETKIVMILCENEETKVKFPFNFNLILSYELKDNSIVAGYKVENTNDETMYFSIGGHPAFVSPVGKDSLAGDKIKFHGASGIKYGLLNSDGLLEDTLYEFELDENNEVEITKDFYEKDAYIIENSQCNKVSLVEDGKAFVTVEFDAPVFGVWCAKGADAAFTCIEPWYGRTDRAGFGCDLTKREWSNVLEAGKSFEKNYSMTFGE